MIGERLVIQDIAKPTNVNCDARDPYGQADNMKYAVAQPRVFIDRIPVKQY
jgi:hypothetical protein